MKQGLEYFIEGTTGVKVQIKEAIEIGTKIYKMDLGNVYEKEMIIENKSKLRQLKDRVYINMT